MLKEIIEKLKNRGDKNTAESGKRFFKEPVKLYGLKAADSKAVIKEYLPQIDKMEKADVFELAVGLMETGYMEAISVASEFVYRIRRKFEKSDFETFERWVNEYITNWANCDGFCNNSMNALIEMYPALIKDIKKWTASKNRWVRRGAAVTFIISARHGRFIDDVFEIADRMLIDADDMVPKGYGWALKAASESCPLRVYDFVTQRADKMPRTAYRYALEKLPDGMRKKAMAL